MIPASLKIGVAVWPINRCAIPPKEKAVGICHTDSQTIDIEQELTPVSQEITLLHETLHATASFAGLDEDTKYTLEEIFSRIDSPLHMVLRENGTWFHTEK